ncbi:transposase [Streptomyces avidinii]|nr:transposase [Streptomyces avidinii]WTA95632.1 transposase [Streptomyces avidinii]
MTDVQWAVVCPVLPLQGRGGQSEAYCRRAMLDTVLYLVDNGTKWRAMSAARARTAAASTAAGLSTGVSGTR